MEFFQQEFRVRECNYINKVWLAARTLCWVHFVFPLHFPYLHEIEHERDMSAYWSVRSGFDWLRLSVNGMWQVQETSFQQVNYRPKRSFGQGNIFTPVCHSVHRGGEYLTRYQVHPPGTRYIPPEPGTPPQDQVHPPGPGTPPRTRCTPQD